MTSPIMAARAFKYPLTNTTNEAEMLKASMGVSHEGLVSPAISVNVRWGWNKTEDIRAKSNRRTGTEGFDSVIIVIPFKNDAKILSCFQKRDSLTINEKTAGKVPSRFDF